MKRDSLIQYAIISIVTFAIIITIAFTFKLFQAEKAKYEKIVDEAMVLANYNETIIRLMNMNAGGQMQSSGLQINPIDGMNIQGPVKPKVILYKRFIPDTLCAGSKNPEQKESDDFNKIFENPHTSESDIKTSITAGMNAALNGCYDVDFNVFDSLLVNTLNSKGFDVPYSLELFYADSTALCKDIATPGFRKPKLLYSYMHQLPLNDDGTAYYQFTSAPFFVLMGKFSGVLFLTVLAMIILVFSLTYLFKTIKKLRMTEALQNEFTHIVTHNMKNPLAVSKASAELLSSFETLKGDERGMKLISMIIKQSDMLARQIDSILKPYKIEDLGPDFKTENFDLSPVVNEIVDQMSITFPDATFQACLDGDACVMANRAMVVDMLENLIQNSVKYSKGAPHVSVTWASGPAESELTVRDNGIGIPKDKIKYIFDRYYKVEKHSSISGYGLGLYYVKKIVDIHHWKIRAESELGIGSAFIITIPNALGNEQC